MGVRELVERYLEPMARAVVASIEADLIKGGWIMTDEMLVEQLLAEGQADTILTKAKAAGYAVVAFNVTTDLVPHSLSYAWNRGKTSVMPLDQRDAHGFTFAMPGPDYDEWSRPGSIAGPRIWAIVMDAMQGGSCGQGGLNGHHYQLAPKCGKRVYILEDGEWVRIE